MNAVTTEVLELVLRGFVPWPTGLDDPMVAGARSAIRSLACETCRAWAKALRRAGRNVPEPADGEAEPAGAFGICGSCRADRKTARALAERLGVHVTPTSPARCLRTLGALESLERSSATGDAS